MVSTATNKQPPSKAKAKQAKAPALKDHRVLNVLTGFLCSVMDNLDSKDASHQALFEGFAFLILEKLGSRLYVIVFGHSRPALIEEDIGASMQADEIEDSERPTTTKLEELQLRAAKLEAPYLVHLLKCIMNAAPAHLGVNISNKSSKAKQAASKGSSKGALTITAKERLQRTLVNCMFGTEGLDDNDPFMDCLRMPATSSVNIPIPKVKEVDMQDWFKEEIWRLIGWDILSREGDW